DFFKEPILEECENLNIVSFDIECQNDGTFPTADKNIVTHIGLDFYNKVQSKKCMCLIAVDLFTQNDIADINNHPLSYYYNINELPKEQVPRILNSDYIWKFMSEKNLLLFIKYLLESTTIDYILTYNGNNFDIQYINK